MKKLLSCVAVTFMFVACGSDAPDVVVKKHINASIKADGEEAAEYVYFKSEDEKKEYIELLNKDAKKLKAHIAKSGFKLINAFVVNESESKAKVKVVVELDGQTDDKELDLIKIDGTWYMDEPIK